jgi:hypothetical protein
VAGVIILGLSFVTIPKAVSYINTRNLDDAIYKINGSSFNNALVNQIKKVDLKSPSKKIKNLVALDNTSV